MPEIGGEARLQSAPPEGPEGAPKLPFHHGRETGFPAPLEAGSSRLLDDDARFDGGCRHEKQLDGAA
jgi:hypothetical protein